MKTIHLEQAIAAAFRAMPGEIIARLNRAEWRALAMALHDALKAQIGPLAVDEDARKNLEHTVVEQDNEIKQQRDRIKELEGSLKAEASHAAALMREVLSLRGRFDEDITAQACSDLANEAMELRQALLKHGRHLRHCASLEAAERKAKPVACDCGLTAALRRQP